MLIKSVNWLITDTCNLKCRHCDIWKLPAKITSQKLVEKLLADPVVEKSYVYYGERFDISLGGGEPFTYPHLQELVTQIEQKYSGALKAITTNGMLIKKIYRFLKDNPNLCLKLNISVDGMKESHDKIRGVKGAFDQTIQTIRMIRRVFPDQKVELKMTMMRENASQVRDVYQLAKGLGCSFSCKPADYLPHYTNRDSEFSVSFSDEEFYAIRNQLFIVADDMRQNKEYKKSRFTKDIPFYFQGKRRHTTCSVLWQHITAMPDGDIFFCIKEEKAGNILNENLGTMKTKAKDFECKSCMLMCGSFKDYQETPYQETVANIEATLDCNLFCAMCTQKQLQGVGGMMSVETFAGVIRKQDIDHVSFVGGESFLNKDIFIMMSLLDSKGITYELTTNGTLFSEEHKRKLLGCTGLKKLNFSLDGPEDYHDRVRGKGVFHKTMEALLFARKYFSVSVVSVITSENLPALPELCEYLKSCGILSHKFIYAMDIQDAAIRHSLAKIPELQIQGPQCGQQVKDPEDLIRLFSELEVISPDISYEPKVMRMHTKRFFEDRRLGECKQLRQSRYAPNGTRIICEFIRNGYAQKLRDDIKTAELDVCKRCCKIEHLK